MRKAESIHWTVYQIFPFLSLLLFWTLVDFVGVISGSHVGSGVSVAVLLRCSRKRFRRRYFSRRLFCQNLVAYSSFGLVVVRLVRRLVTEPYLGELLRNCRLIP